MIIQFGSGVLYAVPALGNLPANPTPFRFGVLQEVNLDFKADLKKLHGQFQLPIATARGKIDVTIKGKLAVFELSMLSQLYFALGTVQGYNLQVDGEVQTVAANAATVTNIPIVDDWGVQYASNAQSFINVASNPLAGQYSGPNLTTGKYTFNSGDNGVNVKISYDYFVNVGSTMTITNQLMGYAPELKMRLFSRFRNKFLAADLNDVTLGSLAVPTKLEDFWIADFDGSANADASGTLGKLAMDNA
jgi:hypothetical protein